MEGRGRAWQAGGRGASRGRSEPTPTGDGSPRKGPAHLRSPSKRAPTLASHSRRPVFRCKPLERRAAFHCRPNRTAKSLPHDSCRPRKMRKPGNLRQAVRIGACFPVGADDSTSNARTVGSARSLLRRPQGIAASRFGRSGCQAGNAAETPETLAVDETASSLGRPFTIALRAGGTAVSTWDALSASPEPTSSSTQ